MNLLHVVPTYFPASRYGGPIASVHGLCKALVQRGHRVDVFTTNVDGPLNLDVSCESPVEVDGVKVWYFPIWYFRKLYYSPAMAKAISRRVLDFDLAHLHSIFRWPTSAVARALSKAGVPYLISPRGMLVKELVRRKNYWLKLLWIQWVERRTLEEAQVIHVTSLLEANEMKAFQFKWPPIVAVPNGVEVNLENSDKQPISPSISSLLEKKPFILFLGRLNWKKGLDRLIPALKYVPETLLVVAGNDEDHYRKKLEKLALESGVKNRVAFVGPVYGRDKQALFETASILALPSYSENFGNVVLEAMAAGCPVVITPEVGLARIVKSNGAGVVVKGKPHLLGDMLKALLSDPKKCEEMGTAGKKVVSQYFNWHTIAQQMETIYQKIAHAS